jgi:hypothetical protein
VLDDAALLEPVRSPKVRVFLEALSAALAQEATRAGGAERAYGAAP